MKICTQLFRLELLLILCPFFVSQIYAQQLAYSDTPQHVQQSTQKMLRTVLEELENQYEVSFTYRNDLVENKRVVHNPEQGQLNLEQKLDQLLKPLDLQYREMKKGFYLIFPAIKMLDRQKMEKGKSSADISTVVLPDDQAIIPPLINVNVLNEIQEQTISGKVTDGESGEPLPGVNVLAKGTTTGTVTDIKGVYRLTVSDEVTALVFSSIGYLTEEVHLNGRNTIDLALMPDIQSLSEVVVVGYGTQKKSDLTGSVASIPKERLDKIPNNNVVQALQGALPGVSIVQNNGGAEGNDFSILVRGRNSIRANNSPLIIVDGIPYSGNISDLNPRDIESIEVLKDASSAAIYGSRASNGVILITTLKGKSGEPTITYDGFYGVMNIANLPDLMNGAEFHEFKRQREPDQLTLTEENNFEEGRFTDWVDLATRVGTKQQHTLSFNGKFNNTSLYVSGSLLDVQGIALNDDFKRYSGRFNIEQGISDWLKIGTNTQLAYSDRSGVPVDFSDAFFMNPLTNPYQEDGTTLTIYPWPEDIYWWNPLGNILIENKDHAYSVFTNNYLDVDFKFIEGLTYKLNTGVEYNQRKITEYNGRGTKDGFERKGEAIISDHLNLNLVVENILNYRLNLNQHKLDFTALYSFQDGEFNSNRVYGQNFENDILTFYQINLGEFIDVTNNYSKESIISQMGRINYNFDDRYLITLTGRRDGYSGFGRNQKYGFFPSVALGWNLTNENFINTSETLSFLKFRASYGRNGNQAVGAYNTLARMESEPYLIGNNTAPGYIPGTLENNTLGWETTTALNLGLDYGFLDDRLNGSVNYYHNTTIDLLLERSISTVHGFKSIIQNIGKTQNTGVELDLSAALIRNATLQWHTDLNFSMNRNKILELATEEDDILNEWFIGRPIDVNFDLQFDGIYQQGEDIANSAQPNAMPGYVKVRDVNEDGQINGSDRTFIGSLQPDFVWGMINTLTYKNFSFNIFFQGIQGITRLNTLRGDDPAGDDVRKRYKINTTFWTPENPIDTYWANDPNANPFNVGIYEDASFVRLKDITLSYNLPSNVTSNLGINMFRAYFNVRNALTITNWSGLDPELNDQRAIPLQREFILGINFQF